MYAKMTPQEMLITNPDGTTSPIKQEKVTDLKKTLGIHDSPSGAMLLTSSILKRK